MQFIIDCIQETWFVLIFIGCLLTLMSKEVKEKKRRTTSMKTPLSLLKSLINK